MNIEYNLIKSEKNSEERHLPFSRVHDFDWSDAVIGEDTRYEYPEPRYIAVGYLEYRLHVLCFTPIEDGIRVISFRKANKREARKNEKAINR
ncbi:MAG: BrnT family toxin [gamma proteobacterium symbiont of Taylorina sp.]|nr:BrnT family toxin [gamma proteobacterium symbiont of Taylorina sp.]